MYNFLAIPTPPATVNAPVVVEVASVAGSITVCVPVAVITLALVPELATAKLNLEISPLLVTSINVQSIEPCSAKPPASSIPILIPTPIPLAAVPDVV